jgi:hypothetical protein
VKEALVTSAAEADRPSRRVQRRGNLAAAAFWLFGSALVALAQPNSARGIAAAGAAAAGLATILVVSRLTQDPDRRYFRSLIGAMVAVSVVGDWLVQRLNGDANGFVQYGLDTRIALPLIFVLLAPLVIRAMPVRLRSGALWRDRALIVRQASPLDWVVGAYALLILPDLLLGFAHHAPKTYIAQDLGLIVFLVFAYVAGRTVSVQAGRDSAIELIVVLLLLGAAQTVFGWDTTPIFTYVEAACAAGVAFALLRQSRASLLLLAFAIALLAHDAVAIKTGTGSTTAIELAAALGIVVYLVVRVRGLLPEWLAVAIAATALVGFIAFTHNGQTVRGQYLGMDASNLGRTYEAHQVQKAIHATPVSFVFGRGLGGTINETNAPRAFAESLVYGGRDLAHVQQVHLLPYEFLLKYGLLGFVWLGAFVVGVAILAIRALESATRHRDPTPVVYAALPLLGIAAALAAATHLQDNPLNALAVGVLVTRFGGQPSPWPRLGLAVPVTAAVCAVVGAVAFGGRVAPFPTTSVAGVPNDVAFVGDVRVFYPRPYHRRYFSTTSDAVTGVHGSRVQGVVVASYPLRKSPELGGPGQRLRPDGVFFELYQAPRRPHYQAPRRTFPLTIFDLQTVRALTSTETTEQGGLVFRVKGRNYRMILWVGKDAPKSALFIVDDLVGSIQPAPKHVKPRARAQPRTPGHKHRQSARR